jgi:hypothetical protein
MAVCMTSCVLQIIRSYVTFLTSHIVILCTRNPVFNWWFSLLFPQRKKIWFACSEPSLSHLDSRTLTNCNLYLTNSLISLLCDPDLYLLFISQVSNIVSIFRCFGQSRGSLQVWSFVKHFTTWYFLRRVILTSSPNPQTWGSPFVGCPRIIFPYLRSCPPSMEAVSSIRCLRTRRALMTGSLLTCAVSVFRGLGGYEAWNCWKVYSTIQKRNTSKILYVEPRRITFLRSHTLIKLASRNAVGH